MAKPKFPKALYVTMMEDGDETYPVAQEYLQDIPEDEHESMVAIYELKSVKQFLVHKSLK
jgi:hypothetical protein